MASNKEIDKKQEDLLQGIENFNRIVLENSPDCIKLIDAEGKIQYMNTNGMCIMELDDFGQIRNKPWVELWGEENSHLVKEAIDKALHGETAQFQALCPTAKGTPKWWDVMVSPLFQSDSKIVNNIISVSRDITKQKEILSLLEYRKALLEAHNESSLDGILLVDARGKILSYNHKFIEIWKIPQHILDAKDDEAALSFATTQLVSPSQFIEKVKYLYDHPTETSTDTLEFKDGKIVERHGYPVMASNGLYYAWSWTFKDITQQKLAENKLRQSEKNLRKTTEHFQIATTAAEVGTWSLDLSSQALEWSGLHKRMWGYDENRSDLLYEDWYKVILSEDKEAAFAEVEKALTTKTLYQATYRIRRVSDGEERWIRSSGQYFYNAAGEAVTLTGVSIDITQEKKAGIALIESEKRFRLLADSMPQHVWTADAKGNLNYFNKSVFDYSGLSIEQILKEGWLQIVHPDDREENIRQWMASIQSGKDFLFEHRFKRNDGEYRWQLSRAVPQKDADGNITMWVGSSTEIQKIKEEEKRKDDFLKMVSHELKTPVTSIKGYVQFLLTILNEKKDPSFSFLQAPLQRIESQVGRLGRLISEMLDLSRLDTDKLALQKEIFCINDLVADTVQDIGFTNSSHDITIQNNINASVNADKNRIGQVIINLVTNAIKYSPDKNNINISINSSGNKNASISIKDYGIGIDKEHQLKIFERFYRAGWQNEQTYAGFGIGLYIASEIIKRHGGAISVESEKDKGSTFIFTLPITK